MSTKKQTTTDNSVKFDPQSMSLYHAASAGGVNTLLDYVNNPGKLQNAWMQQANNAIGQIGNRMNSNLFANLRSGAFGSGNQTAFTTAQLARNSRAVGAMQGNAFLNTLFQSDARRLGAAQSLMAYQPLQTGSHSNAVEQTSGLGTWLPQLAGAGLSAAMAFGTGGASLAFPGMSPGMISGAFGGPTSATPFNMTPYNNSFIPPAGGN